MKLVSGLAQAKHYRRWENLMFRAASVLMSVVRRAKRIKPAIEVAHCNLEYIR